MSKSWADRYFTALFEQKRAEAAALCKKQAKDIRRLTQTIEGQRATIKEQKDEIRIAAAEIEALTKNRDRLQNEVDLMKDIIGQLRRWQELQLATTEKEIALRERARFLAANAQTLESDRDALS